MDGGRPPIVSIPRDLSFYGTISDKKGKKSKPDDGSIYDHDKEISSSGYPVYLTEDWDSGIGGGLWTTGLALGRYFATSPHFLEEFRSFRDFKQENNIPKVDTFTSRIRVLELGSGNGFLGVCLVAAIAVAEANEYDYSNSNPAVGTATEVPEHWPGIEVVVTDTAEHLPLMQSTIESNLKRILPQIWEQQQQQQQQQQNNNTSTHKSRERTADDERNCNLRGEPSPLGGIVFEKIARAEEYLWGGEHATTLDDCNGGEQPFDIIIGSDVAYRDHLHDPLISALDEFCMPQHTVALIGVTMNDTNPIFFQKLLQRGFRYERLADHLLGDEFGTSSRQFGVFCISKR